MPQFHKIDMDLHRLCLSGHRCRHAPRRACLNRRDCHPRAAVPPQERIGSSVPHVAAALPTSYGMRGCATAAEAAGAVADMVRVRLVTGPEAGLEPVGE